MWPYLEIKHIQKKFNVVFAIFNTKAGFSENFFGMCLKWTVLLNSFYPCSPIYLKEKEKGKRKLYCTHVDTKIPFYYI